MPTTPKLNLLLAFDRLWSYWFVVRCHPELHGDVEWGKSTVGYSMDVTLIAPQIDPV